MQRATFLTISLIIAVFAINTKTAEARWTDDESGVRYNCYRYVKYNCSKWFKAPKACKCKKCRRAFNHVQKKYKRLKRRSEKENRQLKAKVHKLESEVYVLQGKLRELKRLRKQVKKLKAERNKLVVQVSRLDTRVRVAENYTMVYRLVYNEGQKKLKQCRSRRASRK